MEVRMAGENRPRAEFEHFAVFPSLLNGGTVWRRRYDKGVCSTIYREPDLPMQKKSKRDLFWDGLIYAYLLIVPYG